MTLKNFLLLLLITITTGASAQMVWNPHWDKDKPEVLEFSSAKHEFSGGLPSYFDTTHAYVRVKLTDENDLFYFLEWKFSGFYEDTDRSPDYSQKMVYITLQHLMMEMPVKVRIEKSNFEVIIMNRDKLDSLQALLAAKVAESFPTRRTTPDAQLEEVVNSLVSLKVDEKMYGLISEFYSIYSVNGVVPNVKHDYNNDETAALNDTTVDQVRAATTEFYILDDKDPALYKWRYESKFDWSKMPDNVQQAVKKKASISASFADVTTDIHIRKTDKLVTLFHSVSDNGNIPGTTRRELNEETIRKVK